MKPILKSGKSTKSKQNPKFVRNEMFFEVKPYTQTAIFTEKNAGQDQEIDSTEGIKSTKNKDELENLDRNEVHNLEKWMDYNKHKQISNMFNEVKLKQLEKEKKLKEMSEKSVKESYYRFPEVRPNILNTILEEGKHVCATDKYNPQTKPKYLKSFETIKTEANKMIINELIYRKVSNKMKSESEKKLTNTISSPLPTQNNEPPGDSELTNNTINNFKHLQQLFFTYKQNQIINYPELLTRIQHSNQTIEKLFDYTDEVKRISDNSKRNLEYEADLLEEFDVLKRKIEDRKHALKNIRMQIAANNMKLSNQSETNDRIRFRIQNNFDVIMSKVQRSSMSPQLPNPKSRGDPSGLNPNYGIEEFMAMQKMNEEKEKTEKMIRMEIEKIKNDTRGNNLKLEAIETEVLDLRQKKLHFQLELKDIYLTRLKEELKQEDNDSITWIIKAFWRIDKEITNENFPSDLDLEAVNYLYRVAQMEQELLDLKAKQRYEILSLTHNGNRNFKGLLNRDVGDRLSEIRNKLKFMKKEKFQIKKTGAANKVQYRSALEKKLEDQMVEDYFKKCLGDLDINDLEPKEIGEERPENKNFEVQIKNKIEEIDRTKQSEIHRLFHKFRNVGTEDSDFKVFLKVLRILFGAKKVQQILVDFERFKDDVRNKDISTVEKIRPKTSKSNSEYIRVATAKSTKSSSGGVGKVGREGKEEVKRDYGEFYNKMSIDENAVNYKYNLNYNYTPKIKNLEDVNSVYFTHSRVQTAKTLKAVHF